MGDMQGGRSNSPYNYKYKFNSDVPVFEAWVAFISEAQCLYVEMEKKQNWKSLPARRDQGGLVPVKIQKKNNIKRQGVPVRGMVPVLIRGVVPVWVWGMVPVWVRGMVPYYHLTCP